MSAKKYLLFGLFLILVSSLSCDRVFNRDRSLSVEEYLKLRLPDPARKWSKNDLMRATSALEYLKLFKPESLPKKNSRKSGKVFSALVDKDILAFTRDTTVPLNSRAMQIMPFSAYPGGLIGLYTFNTNKKDYYHDELIQIDYFGIYIFDTMLDLARQIALSEDTNDIMLREGTETVVSSYLSHINYIIDRQISNDNFSKMELTDLSKKISASIMQNQKLVRMANTDSLCIKLKIAAEKTHPEDVKKTYEKLLFILNSQSN